MCYYFEGIMLKNMLYKLIASLCTWNDSVGISDIALMSDKRTTLVLPPGGSTNSENSPLAVTLRHREVR